MKKSSRRVLSLALALVLMLSLATAASAATGTSVSWEDSNGAKTLTVIFDDWFGIVRPIPNAAPTAHTYGVSGQYVTYNGSFSVTTNASYQSTGLYDTYLRQAIQKAGNKTSYTVNDGCYGSIAIPATYETGNYAVGVIVTCASGTWGISEGMILNGAASTAAVLPSGNIYYAPWGYSIPGVQQAYEIGVIPC